MLNIVNHQSTFLNKLGRIFLLGLAFTTMMVGIAEAQSINAIQFSLIDVKTKKAVSGYENLSNNQTIDMSKLVGKQLTIEAKANSVRAASMKMSLGSSIRRTENEAPYSLFGDTDGAFRAGQLPLGKLDLSAEAYSASGAKGSILARQSINISIVNNGTSTPQPEQPNGTPTETTDVIQFSLIDTATNKAISGFESLINNQVIDLKNLAGKKLSIEAKVANSLKASSVKISLGGLQTVENEAPYSLFGDSSGKFRSGTIPMGTSELKAVAYSSSNAKGSVLANANISINIVNTSSGGPTNPGDSTTPDTIIEQNGMIKIELESAEIKNAGWVKGADGDIKFIYWNGADYKSKEESSDIPSKDQNALLTFKFSIASPGTFKFFFNTLRQPINGILEDDGEENDIFVGMAGGIQKDTKVFTNIAPKGFWYLGGRWKPAGQTSNSSPTFTFNQAGVYTLRVMPRSKNFRLDRIELQRQDGGNTGGNTNLACGTTAHGGTRNLTVYDSASPAVGQACVSSTLVQTCNNGNFSPTAQAAGKSESCSPQTGGGTTNPGNVGQLSAPSSTSVAAAIAQLTKLNPTPGSDRYGKPLMFDFDRTYPGGAMTLGGRWGGASILAAIASLKGDTSTDAQVLRQIRQVINRGTDPSPLVPSSRTNPKDPIANGGYPAQHERSIAVTFIIAKQIPRLWSQLSADEMKAADAMMKGLFIASAFTSSDNNPYVKADGTEYALDGDSNLNRAWAPNYREGMIGGVLAGISYFGVSQAKNILNNYNHNEFLAELNSANLMNMYNTFNWKVANPSSKAPSASVITSSIKNYSYEGLGLDNYMAIYGKLTSNTFSKNVSCGLNGGKGATAKIKVTEASATCGMIVSGCDTLPNKGAAGMLQELDTIDGGGVRSSILYAYEGYRTNQSNQLALIVSGLWKADSSEAKSMQSLYKVGFADMLYKLNKGYYNVSKGYCDTSNGARKIHDLTDMDSGYQFILPIWTEVLAPFHGVSTSGGGTTIPGGSTTNPGGGTTTPTYKACGNIAHGATQSVQIYSASSVPAGQSCDSVKLAPIVQTCQDGVLSPSISANQITSCAPVVPAGASGCSCERPALAEGAFPTKATVGHCGTLKKVSANLGDRLEIKDSWIKANNIQKNAAGMYVVDGIEAPGSIHIFVSNLILCNFKADAVKITDNMSNVVVQDGTVGDPEASTLLLFGPNSSGKFTRIYSYGGSSDGLRVTTTKAGGVQEISQGYFEEVGKNRTSSSHSDLVQTYPVPGKGVYHNSLIKQNYFSSALFSGGGAGRAVNATWMSMTDGAHFVGNMVDRVYQGFWYQWDNPEIEIRGNVFQKGQVEGTKYLNCNNEPNVKHSDNFWFTWSGSQIVRGERLWGSCERK